MKPNPERKRKLWNLCRANFAIGQVFSLRMLRELDPTFKHHDWPYIVFFKMIGLVGFNQIHRKAPGYFLLTKKEFPEEHLWVSVEKSVEKGKLIYLQPPAPPRPKRTAQARNMGLWTRLDAPLYNHRIEGSTKVCFICGYDTWTRTDRSSLLDGWQKDKQGHYFCPKHRDDRRRQDVGSANKNIPR